MLYLGLFCFLLVFWAVFSVKARTESDSFPLPADFLSSPNEVTGLFSAIQLKGAIQAFESDPAPGAGRFKKILQEFIETDSADLFQTRRGALLQLSLDQMNQVLQSFRILIMRRRLILKRCADFNYMVIILALLGKRYFDWSESEAPFFSFSLCFSFLVFVLGNAIFVFILELIFEVERKKAQDRFARIQKAYAIEKLFILGLQGTLTMEKWTQAVQQINYTESHFVL